MSSEMKEIQERLEQDLFTARMTLNEYVSKLSNESITGDGYGHMSFDNDLLRAQYQGEYLSDLIERFTEHVENLGWQWKER